MDKCSSTAWIPVLAALAACHPATPPPGSSADPDAAFSVAVDASLLDAPPLPPQTARLRFVNHCASSIWMAHSDNVPFAQNIELAPGAFVDHDVPAGGLPSARFWPKVGCDASGHNCAIGDTGEGGGAPCAPTGCHPPIDSKFEVSFAPLTSPAATFYNLSLVDGFTLPFSVTPLGDGAGASSCTSSDCSSLSLSACPADLQIPFGCLSPCKAWHYPPPYGLGNPESEDPGLHLCCPTPIDPNSGACTPSNGCMTPDACRDASDPLSVVHTDYVALIHDRCPTAYAYSYDDAAGLHACPATTAFTVVFCP